MYFTFACVITFPDFAHFEPTFITEFAKLSFAGTSKRENVKIENSNFLEIGKFLATKAKCGLGTFIPSPHLYFSF